MQDFSIGVVSLRGYLSRKVAEHGREQAKTGVALVMEPRGQSLAVPGRGASRADHRLRGRGSGHH
eukprot:5987049-Lingulodinium_polyedra.AAC.1